MKKNNGYSIIELLAVIAIIAAVAITSVAVTRTILPRSYLSTTINKFSADYAYARQLASKENRYVAFVFNNDGTSYTLETQNNIGAFGVGPTYWTPIKRKKDISPMGGRKFINSPTNFTINSLGEIRDYPNCGGMISVVLNFSFAKGIQDYGSQIKLYQNGGIKIGKIKRK